MCMGLSAGPSMNLYVREAPERFPYKADNTEAFPSAQSPTGLEIYWMTDYPKARTLFPILFIYLSQTRRKSPNKWEYVGFTA